MNPERNPNLEDEMAVGAPETSFGLRKLRGDHQGVPEPSASLRGLGVEGLEFRV